MFKPLYYNNRKSCYFNKISHSKISTSQSSIQLRSKIAICFILLIFINFSGWADDFSKFIRPIERLLSSDVPISIAVVDASDHRRPLSSLEKKLLERLDRYQSFFLIDRTTIDSILKEQELGLSGIVQHEDIPNIGNLVGATHICVHEQGNLRLIEVESGRIISVFESKSNTTRKKPRFDLSAPIIERNLILSLGLGFGGGSYLISHPNGSDKDFSFAMLFTGAVGTPFFSWLSIQLLFGYCLDIIYYYDPDSTTSVIGSSYPSSSRNGGGPLIGLRTSIKIKRNLLLHLELGYLNTDAVYNGLYLAIGIGVDNWGFVVSPTTSGFTFSAFYSFEIE